MDDNQYKIQLGVSLDTSDLKTEINKIDGKHNVKLGVDLKVNDIRDRIGQYNTNKNNAKVKLGVKLDTDDLKRQINQLNLGSSGKGVAIPINTASLEQSLAEVKGVIASIQKSIGNIGDGSEMKPLLSSVNQIADALGKVGNETQSVISALNALSKKDFGVNVGLNMGGSNNPIARNAAYGNKVRSETLPQLKKQTESLVKYVNDYYKTSYNEFEALQKLVNGTKLGTGDFYQNFLFGEDSVASRMSGGSLNGQMQALKQYIDMFKQAANLKGLDLSSVTSGFSKTADDLIKDAQDIQTGAKEAKEGFEQLKGVFGASIDAESLASQLDPIVKKLEEIRIAIDGLTNNESLDGLTQSFNKLSDTLETLSGNIEKVREALNIGVSSSEQAQQAKESADTVVQSEERKQQAYKETANEAKRLDNVSVDISDGNIDDLKNALKNLKVDDSSIENATKELNEMNIVAKSVSGTLKDGKLVSWDIKGVQTTTDGLKRAVTITKTLGQEGWTSSQKYSQALNEIAVAAEKVNKKLKSGTTGNTNFDVEIADVTKKFDNLSNKSINLQEKINLLKQEFNNIKTASAKGDLEALVAANERYEQVLQDVNNQLRLNRQAEQQANGRDTLETARQNALLRLKNLFGENSEAARKFGAELNRIQKEINECGNLSGITDLNKQITNLALKVKEADVSTQTFGQKFKKQWQQYTQYFSVASVFMYAEQGLRSMFEQVKLVDSAMTELKKVTNETDAAYSKFLKNASSRAKELGTTVDGLVDSTASFARLGYGFEDAQGLAEVANIYSVVGDEIDGVEGATESLVSTMAAFKDEMKGMSNVDFATSIVDKFNEIGNNFAISSGGIGEALERSASSMMAANNSLDETIALITAANTVVQDPEAVGRLMPT